MRQRRHARVRPTSKTAAAKVHTVLQDLEGLATDLRRATIGSTVYTNVCQPTKCTCQAAASRCKRRKHATHTHVRHDLAVYPGR
jgi:hypothetical protein